METRIFTGDLSGAAAILKSGGLVAVPTETVYGLAGNGLDEEAVRKIYEVKGRPERKPLSLLVPGPEALEQNCREVPPAARALAERFWPGPLTLVLKAKSLVPELVRAGGETVGLRCPDHPMTLELLRQTGLPLAAPSANPSGQPSPKSAAEVLAYFDGKIDAVLDGGVCGLGRESTILDMSARPYRILRRGALPQAELAAALAERLTVLGVTGGSGGGKTSALKVLEHCGALVLDCDEVYHELLRRDKELLSAIETQFPGTVKEGILDRKALGTLVFSDPEKLACLNGITHAHICREVERRLEAWAMAGGGLAAIDAAGLLGSGLERRCDAVIGVLADEETRLRRIMERDSISRDYALLRLRAQKPDSFYEEHCTYIVRNEGDLDDLTHQIKKIIQEVGRHG